jgi:argininosuccinate lyase
MSDKAWGGRFEKELDAIAARFSASVDVDGRLWPQDIDGSIAHVRMLADRKILSTADADQIVAGLTNIRASIERGDFDWDASKEDVHMNIEAALTSAIGEAGGRLHTGRSRNDQVATDMRLWTRQACGSVVADIDGLLEVLVDKADGHIDFLMPGYTHPSTRPSA